MANGEGIVIGENVMFEENEEEFIFRIKKSGDCGLSQSRKTTTVAKSGMHCPLPGHAGFSINLTVSKKKLSW